MKTIYKVFLVIFVIFIAINLYVFDWTTGFLKVDNATSVLSIAAGLIGIFLVIVLNTWSKLSTSKK